MTRFASFTLILALCFLPTAATAQGLNGDLFQGLQGFDGLGGGGDSDPGLNVTASYVVDPSRTHGQVSVTATVGNGWCLYSTTQPKGGPLPTELKIADAPAITAVGTFTPDHKPKIVPPDEIITVPQEKFYNTVTWTAPFLLPADINPETLNLKVLLKGQSCHDRGTCFPVRGEAVAKFAGMKEVPLDKSLVAEEPEKPQTATTPTDYKIQGKPGDFKSASGHVVISGSFTPTKVAPGDQVTVNLTVKPSGAYHVYAYSPTDATIGYKSTQIALAEATGWLAMQPTTDNPIHEKELTPGFDPIRYHEGDTTWKFKVQVPIDAKPGKYPLVGYLGFQTCTDSTCDRPEGVMFEGIVEVGPGAAFTESAPLAFSKATYSKAAERAKITHAPVQEAAEDQANTPPAGGNAPPAPGDQAAAPLAVPAEGHSFEWKVLNQPESSSLGWILMLSFVGGAILNLMPCVLPVVGLKILSFVNQAGKHRGQVFMLNLVYSAGVISVFLFLAVLSTSLGTIMGLFVKSEPGAADGLAWGQWSGNVWYILGMIVLVYTMGLSMLGVWELSMPSFLGSGSVAQAANKSGYGSAFFKGIVTTLLSTPCSGPFLGPIFGYTLSESAYITFLVFGFIGLGMSSPYLIIGINPRLIAFLPKPGNWMVAFKQAMGFVMMLTVVYLLYTMEDKWVVPTLTLLVGLAAGCWMLGQVHTLEHQSSKLATTIGAFAVSIFVGLFAFNYLVEGGAETIAWDKYTPTRFADLEADVRARQSAGETVMVDFTADWCPTCKLNYYRAINTDKVAAYVEANGISPVLVDWTTNDSNDPVQQFINKLGFNSIPLLAIFPGGRPGEVYVLSDLLDETTVIDSLNTAQGTAQAVPKQTALNK
ncbi:thioredoxin family protein [Bremerella cremea]|nr:thioredoxin family protein [Bremerella cremea]